MKRLMMIAVLVFAGCQSTVSEPEQTTVLAGDYQVLSDCFYRQVATSPGYRKVDTPSARTNTIEGGSGDKIEFTATGEGITRVHARLGGDDAAWTRYLSVLKQCEQPSD